MSTSTTGSLNDGPLIARGAFGVVRLCHSSTYGLCAVKSIPLPSEESWLSARREARALQLAAGPMTVRLLGLERLEPSQERPVPVGLLVMEYVSGGTLANLAQNWRPGTGRGIPEGLLRRYVRSLVEALAHVHAKGMAHRDLKGANVMLAPESQSIKLADFGSCKLPASVGEDLEGPSELSPGGQARPTTAISAHGVQRGGVKGGGGGEGPNNSRGEVGTIAWMAPEVVTRGRSASSAAGAAGGGDRAPQKNTVAFWQAADVWGLGCTVLELVTGKPPWHGEAEEASEIMLCIASSDLREKLPTWLKPTTRAFLVACLDPHPTARPTTAALLKEHPFLQGSDFRDEEEKVGGETALKVNAKGGGLGGAVGAGGRLPPNAISPPHKLGSGGKLATVTIPLAALLSSSPGVLLPATWGAALKSCEVLKSEVRLSCRQVQHWYTALSKGGGGAGGGSSSSSSNSTDWVGQCLFTEEKLGVGGEWGEGFLTVAEGYGEGTVSLVTEACAAPPVTVAYRECASGIVFGPYMAQGEAAWTTRVEASVLMLAMVSKGKATPQGKDWGVISFLLHLLEVRLSHWDVAGMPLNRAAGVGGAFFSLTDSCDFVDTSRGGSSTGGGGGGKEVEVEGEGEGGDTSPKLTLTSLAVALQWLATARDRLAWKASKEMEAKEFGDDEDEAEDGEVWEGIAHQQQLHDEGGLGGGGGEGTGGISPPTPVVPDFAVLFYTRVNVWVAELAVVLKVLATVSEWWPEAAAASPSPAQSSEAFGLPALASTHQALSRKAYGRFLGIRKTWQYGKGAVGFGGPTAAVSPRK